VKEWWWGCGERMGIRKLEEREQELMVRLMIGQAVIEPVL
jgi:hypothetical protein